MKERPIEPWQVQVLACSLEHRGNDATGLAVQFADGRIEVHKNHEPAWRFLSDDKTKAWLEKQLSDATHKTVLVHTRRMTKGSHWDNANNHPMYAGKSAVVHNGMISNDDSLFTQLDLERRAETDSDILRAIVDKHGLNRGLIGHDGKLCKIFGSVAASIIHPDAPGDVLLLRSNNPLYIGSNEDHLCWASTKRSVYLALKRWIDRFGIMQAVHDDKLAFVSMPNNTGWLMGDKLKWHEKFDASSYQRVVNYDVHKPDWLVRRKKAEEDAAKKREESKPTGRTWPPEDVRALTGGAPNPPRHLAGVDFVVCPGKDQSGKSCGTILDIRAMKEQGKGLSEMECTICQTNLWKANACHQDGTLIRLN